MSNANQRPHLSRRDFLQRAAMAGIALPSMAAILAACSSGAQQTVNSGSAAPTGSAGANPYGTGGIAGAPYPLARQDSPVTWTLQSDNPVIDSGMEPEKNATLQVMRWPYYMDQGVIAAFEAQYDCKIEQTVFSDMDKGIAKIDSGQGDYDIMFGMNVWAVGRAVAKGILRPVNHDYITNMSNLWDQFQSPFYDVGAQFTLPYSVWSTGIFWRNDQIDIDPHSMDNPYDVFWDAPPKGKTHLLANAQDVLAMPMFRDGMTDVNIADAAAITKAKDDITEIATKAGGLKYDHSDYTEVPAGQAWLHQSWSGNASDAVVLYSLPASQSSLLSYYWPGSDGHPANTDNDAIVLLKTGKYPVLAHLLANWFLDAKQSFASFSGTTGYQVPLKSMTPESMVKSGVLPANLSSVILSEEDFGKGSRELELAPDIDTLWQQAFAQLQAGV